MKPVRALQLILAISLFGVLFSGTLTYRELTGATAQMCPSPGAPGTIFGYPACVYGLAMYIILSVLATLGLRGARHASPSAQPPLPASSGARSNHENRHATAT